MPWGNLTSGHFSPILSTLNASWDNISPTQQKDCIRKGRGAVAVALSVISPGQEKDLWKCTQNDLDIIERNENSSSKRKHFDANTGLIDVLIKVHDQEESWQTKRQILSLFANDFSRRELQTLIPGLTKWTIDQARQHATKARKGLVVPEQTIFRKRVDQGKLIISLAIFHNHSCIKMLHLEQKLLSLTLANALQFRLLCGP